MECLPVRRLPPPALTGSCGAIRVSLSFFDQVIMHPQVQRFLDEVCQRLPEVATSQRVMEFGAYDINGSPRAVFAMAQEYVGLDWRPGPGVDVVSLAHEYRGHPDGYFDAVISTEMLEHDPHWRESVARMVALVRPGGCLVLTCAGPLRPAHEMDCTPGAGYYGGISLAELAGLVRELVGWTLVWGEEHDYPSDTYLAAVGKRAFCAQTVSVVVGALDNATLTARAVRSLREHATENPEIVLVDNGSQPDESRMLMGLWPQVYLRYDRALGYPGAMNRGVRHASGRYVALCNNDVEMLTPGWDGLLLEALPEGLGLAAPVVDRIANPAQQMGAAGGEAEVLFFVLVLGSRETFDLVGPLDERFGMGNSEDVDYSLRVRAAGGRLAVTPAVQLRHAAHQTFLRVLGLEGLRELIDHNQGLLAAKYGVGRDASADLSMTGVAHG